MSPLGGALTDYLEAVRRFSRPARRFLVATSMSWFALAVQSVLFNLYLTAGGFRESFVGRTISLTALGIALTALPAGWLADRWGRRRCLILGTAVEGVALALRALTLHPGLIEAASFCAGAGQAIYAIAAAPYITEHSTARERTHLFSAFFSVELLSGVVGSAAGGWIPNALRALPLPWGAGPVETYRVTLLLGAAVAFAASIPLATLGGTPEPVIVHTRSRDRSDARKLVPIALNAFLLGSGAGLVIPFMNLYFATRFHCSSAQIGSFFSIAMVSTAVTAALGPAIARRFGKLRTATAMELLSLPFLVTLGAERRLDVAVVVFWIRATLMQAGSPLLNAFIMESLPPALRARCSSLNNTVWNAGWAVSATLSGVIIQRFGYAVPFYITAVLYATAASFLYLTFRGTPEVSPSAEVPPEPVAHADAPVAE